jgi:hypothetical protein
MRSTFDNALAWTIVSLLVGFAVGCDKGGGTPAGATTPAPPQAMAPAAEPVAASGKQYTIVSAPLTMKVGDKAVAKLRIEPIKGLKFNAEFPTKFTVSGATPAKSEKEKLSSKDGDVVVDGKVGVISVPVVAMAAGTGTISLVGRFSVCSDEQCYVLQDTIALTVTVK